VSNVQVVVATYDLNLRELQFVSDHLTELECRKLSEALTMEDYMLEHPVTGAHEKDVSCITLLLTWDRSDNGRARSFHRLSRRLTQIGRRDLADKLAQMVYDEKSDEVYRQGRPLERGPEGVYGAPRIYDSTFPCNSE